MSALGVSGRILIVGDFPAGDRMLRGRIERYSMKRKDIMKKNGDLMLRAVVVMAAALLALAACGGDDPGDDAGPADSAVVTEEQQTSEAAGDAEPSARIDACALITREEAEAVLGTATREPVRGDTPTINSCAYQTERFDVVSVSVITYADKAEAENVHQSAIDINNYPEIEGLGDRAYNAQPISDVTVLVGRYQLGVDVSGPKNELEVARDLAETAIGRLP